MEIKKRIRLLVTSDVHGYVYPYSYASGKEENYGFAKVKGTVDELRDNNTLLVDNGDVLEGSPLAFYHFHKNKMHVSPMSRAMNEVGYDFVNVGNHDFNYGEECLMQHLNALHGKCITANWLYEGKPFFQEYAMKEINGVRLALFGLVTDYIPHWEQKENIAHSSFLSVVETAEKLVRKIREKEQPDYVICMYHGGFERNLQSGEPTEDLTGENVAYQL